MSTRMLENNQGSMDSANPCTSISFQTPSPSTSFYADRCPPLSGSNVGDSCGKESSLIGGSSTAPMLRSPIETPSSNVSRRIDFDGLLDSFFLDFHKGFKRLENRLVESDVTKSRRIEELEEALAVSKSKISELETENMKLLSNKKKVEEHAKELKTLADLILMELEQY